MILHERLNDHARVDVALEQTTQAVQRAKAPDAKVRIVKAAIAVFSRQGYHGTSTRDIARLADVSEVTVYRYFSTKEEIFWSALNASFLTIKPRLESLDTRWAGKQLSVVLPEMMRILMDLVVFSPETVRLLAIALLELGAKARDICHKHLSPLYAPMHTYLASTVNLSQLSNVDPAILTATIMLTVVVHQEISSFIPNPAPLKSSGRGAVESYSNFWLSILSPVEVPQK